MTNITYNLSMFKEPEFKIIRKLSQLEFDRYSKYIMSLIFLKNDENLFKIVELNYDDLINKIQSATDELAQGINNTSEQQYLHLEINRLILNLLSSIRTYLDHTETRFKREYGIESAEFNIFKTATSKAYDENFSYRFLYKLRNYSQHCGLPAGSLKAHSFSENGVSKYVLELSLLRDELLKNFEWGNPITKELKKQEQIFDIISLIKTKFHLLQTINENVKDLSYNHYKEEGLALLNLLQEIEDKDGAPCIFATKQVTDNQAQLNIHWFPFDGITKITGVKLY